MRITFAARRPQAERGWGTPLAAVGLLFGIFSSLLSFRDEAWLAFYRMRERLWPVPNFELFYPSAPEWFISMIERGFLLSGTVGVALALWAIVSRFASEVRIDSGKPTT